MSIPDKIWRGSTLLALVLPATVFAADDVTVRVEAGDTTTIAIGENATSQISMGGLPTNSGGKGCAKYRVKVGNVQRIAVGPNAQAIVEIPSRSIHCEAKKP